MKQLYLLASDAALFASQQAMVADQVHQCRMMTIKAPFSPSLARRGAEICTILSMAKRQSATQMSDANHSAASMEWNIVSVA
jgi:hypothetical protein